MITVGAMKDVKTTSRGDDQMASYSSKGPTLFDQVVKPYLVAPVELHDLSLGWTPPVRQTVKTLFTVR